MPWNALSFKRVKWYHMHIALVVVVVHCRSSCCRVSRCRCRVVGVEVVVGVLMPLMMLLQIQYN